MQSRRETKRRLASGTAKYVFNPVVRALFRLGLPVPGTAILETTGRKSGQPRRNPVTNGLDDGVFWIVAEHGRQAGYVRNIEANPCVRVRIGRRWREGTARLVPDDDPRERLRYITSRRPIARLHTATVRLMQTALLTIRIDLNDQDDGHVEHKSVSNQDLCRRFLGAYHPDRLDDLLALLHPDIEWASTETWVEREVWHGHAEVHAGLRRFFFEWEDFSNDEVEAFSDSGDKFAVVTRMRGRSRRTHIPTEMRTSGVLEVRDGLIVRIVGHSDPADALAAVAKPAAAASPAGTGRGSHTS